jgi:hypothetical protein
MAVLRRERRVKVRVTVKLGDLTKQRTLKLLAPKRRT